MLLNHTDDPNNPKISVNPDGNTGFGIVYATDAHSSQNVRVAYKIPQEFHTPIRYPVCIIKDSAHRQAAQKFLLFLKNKDVREIFRKYGFQLA